VVSKDQVAVGVDDVVEVGALGVGVGFGGHRHDAKGG
jgi:hypothetical protein